MAHSMARMPPKEPPSTAAHCRMPSASASSCSARTVSRTVTMGKRPPQGLPSGARSSGPVLPWQPPMAFGATTNQWFVSSARPGPTKPSHQPGLGCPSCAGPATWLSPVKACSTRTALLPSLLSSPQVSYARRTSGRVSPDSKASGWRRCSHLRRPAGIPSRQPPQPGRDAGECCCLTFPELPWPLGSRR